MVEERIYRLQDGKEMVLLAHAKIEGVRYLLLGNEQDDDVEIAVEEDNNLLIIDKQNENYPDVLLVLMKNLEENMDKE
jgi:hypothetical protein